MTETWRGFEARDARSSVDVRWVQSLRSLAVLACRVQGSMAVGGEERMSDVFVIERRFRGPPDSANGGYACGRIASLLGGTVEVTLRSPPPLDHALDVERSGGNVTILASGKLVAEGRPTTIESDPPAPPSWAQAVEAATRYPWFDNHPFPCCFVCGGERAAGDGLRIFPGAVDERTIAAAPFVPDASLLDDESGRVRAEIVWAALDCPSWFGMHCFHPFQGRGVLLGRLAARIDECPRLQDRCICVGWFLGRDGRKMHCGSALYTESGALLAVGKATWIALQ